MSRALASSVLVIAAACAFWKLNLLAYVIDAHLFLSLLAEASGWPAAACAVLSSGSMVMLFIAITVSWLVFLSPPHSEPELYS